MGTGLSGLTIRLRQPPPQQSYALAVPVCTFLPAGNAFYKTEKSITGRRAHNPIHSAVATAGVLPYFVEKPTDLAGRYDEEQQMASERSTDVQASGS